jgi:hypothetical protein
LISLACAAFAFVLFLYLTREREPEYQGKTLSEWMELAYPMGENYEVAQLERGEQAIRAIGTNALPCLLKWVSYEFPDWRKKLCDLTQSSTNVMLTRAVWGKAYYRSFRTEWCLRALGTNAASAIPELESIMNNREREYAGTCAVNALGGIGLPALPALTNALAQPKHPQRYEILFAINEIILTVGSENTNLFLPVLRPLLDDPDQRVKWAAGRVINRLEGRPIPID